VVDSAGPSAAGHLVAVNVGLPRDVRWRGRTVRTAVWKESVDGPHMVRTLNVDGDGQGDLAGHGGPHRAVLVYQLASYQHWSRYFGRDDFVHGQFGENFTVDGLADDDVCIGDRFEVGGALVEVSQPRVTCYRVGLRLGEPQLPALLVSHRRPGFYLRVLREGVVQAGDPFVQVHRDPARMTVADVDGLLYLPGHDSALVAKALEIPALSPGWRASFEALSTVDGNAAGNVGLNDAAGGPPVAWAGFRTHEVVGVVHETSNVVSLRLAATDGRALPAALPGQFVTVAFPLGDGGTPPSRNYSLSGAPGSPEYRVSIKREAFGAVSTFVHSQVRAGTVVSMSAPRGRFTLEPGDSPVVLVSAGIGATPVLAMLHALADRRSTREVWWVHGSRNGSEHPFAAEVRSLLAELPHAHTVICYSAPREADARGRDYTHRGRLTAALLGGLDLPRDAHAYLSHREFRPVRCPRPTRRPARSDGARH
jgi:MOSC domain-containing protein YiiM/ferredoxin-NADP reductase